MDGFRHIFYICVSFCLVISWTTKIDQLLPHHHHHHRHHLACHGHAHTIDFAKVKSPVPKISIIFNNDYSWLRLSVLKKWRKCSATWEGSRTTRGCLGLDKATNLALQAKCLTISTMDMQVATSLPSQHPQLQGSPFWLRVRVFFKLELSSSRRFSSYVLWYHFWSATSTSCLVVLYTKNSLDSDLSIQVIVKISLLYL